MIEVVDYKLRHHLTVSFILRDWESTPRYFAVSTFVQYPCQQLWSYLTYFILN
jgi:hypothetical protein